MFITKKRFNEAIKEAQEKAFTEADKAKWQQEEFAELRHAFSSLIARLEKIDTKGKKRIFCPCAMFPRKY